MSESVRNPNNKGSSSRELAEKIHARTCICEHVPNSESHASCQQSVAEDAAEISAFAASEVARERERHRKDFAEVMKLLQGCHIHLAETKCFACGIIESIQAIEKLYEVKS